MKSPPSPAMNPSESKERAVGDFVPVGGRTACRIVAASEAFVGESLPLEVRVVAEDATVIAVSFQGLRYAAAPESPVRTEITADHPGTVRLMATVYALDNASKRHIANSCASRLVIRGQVVRRVPAGFHLVFVTEGRYVGKFPGGLRGMDTACQDEAIRAGFSNDSFKALASTSTQDAVDRLRIRGRVVDQMGRLIATGARDLFDGSLALPIATTLSGAAVRDDVWTGTDAHGFYPRILPSSAASCLDYWALGATGVSGRSDRADTAAFAVHQTSGSPPALTCDQKARLYCISQ